MANVIVTHVGDIVGCQFKYVPHGCMPDYSNQIAPQWFQRPLYEEVFVITQFWGYAVYHAMIEDLPRAAPFIDFLRRNSNVRIHVYNTVGLAPDLLRILGIAGTRLVSGVVRAKLAYVPPATRCGQANVQQTQILSGLYREYVRSNFPPERQHRLILIRRSHHRRFQHQEAIERVVASAARDFNLTYTLFSDNPVPSLNDTMRLFHSAVMVVAPHGAGEANVVFSPPGVYVVEGVCNRPHSNLCHASTAHALGHRWHGIMSRRGCESVVDVAASAVDAAVRQHLRAWHLETRRPT